MFVTFKREYFLSRSRSILGLAAGSLCAKIFLVALSVFATRLFAISSAEARGRPLLEKPAVENRIPDELLDIGIDQKLGTTIDMNTELTDDNGQAVKLADIVADGKPLLISPAYYACPNLCNLHINGVTAMFKALPKDAGALFHYVVFSIDPRERADLALDKKKNHLADMARADFSSTMHFLTGAAVTTRALADSLGFKYRWDERQKQYAHASAAIVVTPKGVISRYFPGITFDSETVRLSLVEAGQGKVGSVIDKLVLFCFHFDPQMGKYTLTVFNILRTGAVAMILVLIALILPFWIKHRRGEVNR
jgi:protein SCO1